MVPYNKAITIRRGNTKEIVFRVRERTWDEASQTYVTGGYRDLTGWTGLSQVREKSEDLDLGATFTVTIPDQTVSPGTVRLKLSPSQTRAIEFDKGVWDCTLTDPLGDTYTYIAGPVTIKDGYSYV